MNFRFNNLIIKKKMKKSILLSVIAITTAGSLISCDKNDVENKPLDGRKEVKFSSNIVDIVPPPTTTRAGGTTWNANDSIGIYMFEELSETIVESMGNIKYTTENESAVGSFTATGTVIYFPDNGDKVRFMSYYPYTTAISSNTYSVNVSDQTSQSNIDLLYSFDKNAKYDKTTENKLIPLVFEHQLAKININIKTGDGLEITDLEDILVSFEGLYTTASFDLFSGTLSDLNNATKITPSVTTAKEGFVCSYEAIVIPTTASNEAQIVFDLNNGNTDLSTDSDVFTWNFSNSTLEAGKEYTYNVTIRRSKIVVQATISDWGNGSSNDIIAE